MENLKNVMWDIKGVGSTGSTGTSTEPDGHTFGERCTLMIYR